MLDHHLQRAMVYRLALASSLRFSELKPLEIENKLFNYHLKKVISAGYIVKRADGRYELTPTGRRLGVHVLDNIQALVDRAYSVLFLVIRRADGAWLLYKRNNHPLKDRVGFMHVAPQATELVAGTATRVCREKTGLTASFSVLGSGYFRVFDGDNLESFTHFDLLVAENVEGELAQDDELASYFWVDDPRELTNELLPSMPPLLDRYQAGKPFFIDQRLR